MSLPKEPRQKMINMMYLVLTALLALNVSSEILQAFKTVDRSLTKASSVVDANNAVIFKSFQQKLADPKTKDKAAQWYPLAQKAKTLSDDLYNYIENLKKELKTESGLKMVEGKEEFKEDDLDASTRMFINTKEQGGKGKGKELLDRLTAYKEALKAISPEIAKDVYPSLPLDLSPLPTNNEGGKNDWAYGYFHMTPTVASLTILSKFQNDIRNSEAAVVEYCHKEIGEVELIYDQFAAIASANATYVMPGEEITITAGVGAFNKSATPSVSVDGAGATPTPDGAFEYKFKPTSSGIKRVNITFKKPDGTDANVTKEIKYTVGVPSGLVVSTDKTRVFYQGLENPLSVTGGGGDEKVSVDVSAPGLTFKKSGPGQYVVIPEQLGTANIKANDGKVNLNLNIPIKRVPSPIAKVNGSAGGVMAPNIFRVQKGVQADLADFIFEGVKFDVVSFTMVFTGKGFEEVGLEVVDVNGAYFSAEAQQQMRKCQSGTSITISDVKVKGPGGMRKLDQTVTFILQ